jgi:hypothetical protein
MAVTAERRNLKTQPLPKLQLGLYYVAAFAIGLVPYALLIRSFAVWLGLLAILAITFAVASWSREGYGGESPSLAEIAFAMLGRGAAGAIVGLFGIGAYYGVGAGLSLFGVGDGKADAWGFYSSFGLTVLFTLAAAAGDIPDVVHALYPDRPGQRSPYFPLSTQASGMWRLAASALAFAGFAAAVAATVYFEALGQYFVIAVITLNVAFSGVGATYLEAKTLDAAHGTPESAITVIKALLEAAGYRVIPRPRTGNEEADSVISVLDFLAIRPDDAIAGRVRARADQADRDVRYEAASLEPAVWVLEDQLRRQQSAKIRLRPVLLVLGGARNIALDESEQSSSAGKAVKIVHAPSEEELAAMIKAGDKGALKSAAERLFKESDFSMMARGQS